MLEFLAKTAILNPRQSSVFAVSKIHGRVNSGEHSKAAAFCKQVAMISLNQSGLFGSIIYVEAKNNDAVKGVE
jgi:hypothetical protein